MNERRTAVLLAVLALLAIWVFAVEGVGREPDREAGAEPPILDCSAHPIAALRVSRAGDAVGGRQAAGRWTVDLDRERGSRVEPLLADLAEALCRMPVLDRSEATGGDADFGFAPAATEIAIERGGERRTLALGRSTPAGNRLYARFAGERTVLTVGAWFATSSERILAHARE